MSFKVLETLQKVKKEGTKSTFYVFNLVDAYGRKGVDIREHFERSDGSLQHTAKGFIVPLDVYEGFLIGVKDVHEKLQNKGETNG